MKVFLIDDDPDLVVLASFALEKRGTFEVVTSASGDGALDRALSERPDVILLDVKMPGIDGDELIGRFRACTELASTPIIFLTGEEASAEHQRLRRLGARGVIVKPFDPETLAARVLALVRS